MFRREQFPYFFTLILAAMSWLLTRAVDEKTKSPLIAYRIEDSSLGQGERSFTVRLHNISSATAFRNLHVVFTNLDGVKSKFSDAAIEYEPPAYIDKARKTEAEHEAVWALFPLNELQPKTAVRLVARIIGPDKPVIRCDSATDTVRLIEEGFFRTWIVEYETEILFGIAVALAGMLIVYAVSLHRGGVAPAGAVAVMLLLLAPSAFAAPATIKVVDASNGRAVKCDIFYQDRTLQKRPVGKTNEQGICKVDQPGKPGEIYIAVSEEYNPGKTDCPLANATIRVRRTILLPDYVSKAEFFNSVGLPAAAALQFRKAALIAEKRADHKLFNELEYRVAEMTAKILNVRQPFVETVNGVRPSRELIEGLKQYQLSPEIKGSGKLSTETIRELAVTQPPDAHSM